MEPLAPDDILEEWSELSTSSLGPGARLGRYELLIPIAYGGMARVWAARLHGQRGFSKLVAIKTILPHLAHNPEFEKMFLDEARIAAGVHHPNVCEIYELGEEGHVLYLAMEWVNGDSLQRVLRQAPGKPAVPIDWRIAARVVADACAGLHAAHELADDYGRLLNVVHRDVSPHNVLVSLEGTVKVMDFGVAKAYGQSHSETNAGQIKGKVAYMSPEQIGGTCDRRSDVFAMGVVLYEITTGQQPFRGNADPQVMQAVLKGTYDPPPRIVRGYPLELAAIIDRALAPEPRNRYATAERMRVALEEWLAKTGSIVTATQVGSLVRQRVGPNIERVREHIRSASTAQERAKVEERGVTPPSSTWLGQTVPNASEPPGQAHTPAPGTPQPPSAQSRSGVVMAPGQPPPSSGGAAREPMTRTAPMPSPDPYRSAMASSPHMGQSVRPQVPTGQEASYTPSVGMAPGPTGMRYAMAAVAGIGFALVVGVLGAWLWSRSHGGHSAAASPSATVALTSMPTSTPTPTTTTTSIPTSTSVAAAAPSATVPSADDTSTPTTVPPSFDVSRLPTAKPAWATAPPPPPARSAPPSTQKPPAPPPLPANPY